MSHTLKPIVDLSRYWLAPRPSKNYIFHLLHQNIQAINPARSLDAGVGELRNFWMFPGAYVGISHNRPAYRRGMARLTTPQPIADITSPLLTGTSRHPTVFLMRLESDFSFLEEFDLVVSTNTLAYVENRLETLTRLSERVKKGGSLIVDDHIASAAAFQAALKDDYEDIEIVYHGFQDCDEMFASMPGRRDITPEPRFMELAYREMTAPNLPDKHNAFCLIARNKKTDATPPNVTPLLMDDGGLFIVKEDIPHLKMEETDAPTAEVLPTRTFRVKAIRPVLHIGPPKTASTAIQEFIIPKLGRPYLIKPAWGKALTRLQHPEHPVLTSDIVVSDEEFGRFLHNTPAVVAARLSPVVPDATVLYVRRNARDLYRSFYRQTLINNLVQIAAIQEAGLPIKPLSPNEYFDLALGAYRERSVGIFASLDSGRVREAFAKHFEFNILEYDHLRKAPQDFVAAFADLCDCPVPKIDVGRLNTSDEQRIDQAIAEVPIPIPPEILDLYRGYYVDYGLSPERDTYLTAAVS